MRNISIFAILILSICRCTKSYEVLNSNDATEAFEYCQKMLKTPPQIVEQFQKLDFAQHETTACFIQCLLTKLNFYDKHKGFLLNNIISQIGKKYSYMKNGVRDDIIQCMADNWNEDDENCDWVANNFQCFLKKHPAELILNTFS